MNRECRHSISVCLVSCVDTLYQCVLCLVSTLFISLSCFCTLYQSVVFLHLSTARCFYTSQPHVAQTSNVLSFCCFVCARPMCVLTSHVCQKPRVGKRMIIVRGMIAARRMFTVTHTWLMSILPQICLLWHTHEFCLLYHQNIKSTSLFIQIYPFIYMYVWVFMYVSIRVCARAHQHTPAHT